MIFFSINFLLTNDASSLFFKTVNQSVRFDPINNLNVSTIRHGVGCPWSRICIWRTINESSWIKLEFSWINNVPFGYKLTNDGDVNDDNSNVISPFKPRSLSDAIRCRKKSFDDISRFININDVSICNWGQWSFSSRISIENERFVDKGGLPWSDIVRNNG
jgi:hypothetical protein